MHDDSRIATFSSSRGYHLMTSDNKGTGFGAPALKYIKQICHEIKLGRSITNEAEAKQTSWGTFLETRVFNLLDTSYQNTTKQGRLFHPEIKHYSGVPDFLSGFDTVCDCKCSFNMEKFCDKMAALEDYGTFKEEFPADFWQLVSNLVLLRANGLEINFIEAINYVPYLSELPDIRMAAEGDKSMRWLEYTMDNGLPWIPSCSYYKNINIHRFRVMERDVEEWTARIRLAVDTVTGIQSPVISGKRTPEPIRVSADKGPKATLSLGNVLKSIS